MNETDSKIQKLLSNGHSYREIASELGVSSRRISDVKKAGNHLETKTNVISRETEIISPPETQFICQDENTFDETEHRNHQKQLFMENTNIPIRPTESGLAGQIEVELRKVELNHQLEIRKLEIQERELQLQEAKLQIEKELLAKEELKHIEQIRRFQFSFKKLIGNMHEGDWDYEEATDFLETAQNLKDEVEQYAFIHNSNATSIINIEALKQFIITIDDLLNEWEFEDESETLKFDNAIRRILSRESN